MTFSAAAVTVLALLVLALGLLAYHLFTRLSVLEEAVSGGMRTPSRTLSREEFARRFTTARHRSEFAVEINSGVVLFLDKGPTSTDLLHALRHLNTRRGFSLAWADTAPPSVHDIEVHENMGARFDLLGVGVLPFCFVIDEGTVIDARPVGSSAALETLLLEVA